MAMQDFRKGLAHLWLIAVVAELLLQVGITRAPAGMQPEQWYMRHGKNLSTGKKLHRAQCDCVMHDIAWHTPS